MEEAPKVTNDQIQIAKNVIRKLCFRYSHRTLENPKLQTHWSNIEALALEYEKPREVNDDTGNKIMFFKDLYLKCGRSFYKIEWNKCLLQQ